MKKLPFIGIAVLLLLVLSGYVSSHEKTQVVRADGVEHYADRHLNYYEAHLIAIGVRQPRQ
jgi:hypothetical protein